MSALNKFKADTTARKVPDLVDGTKYVIQNLSYGFVEYTNYATDPTESTDDLSWFQLKEGEYILEDHSTADALWVRTPGGTMKTAVLAVGEAE